MQNLQSKTPYKFKKSYGGTPEPQTPQDAPWLRGPSLKNGILRVSWGGKKDARAGFRVKTTFFRIIIRGDYYDAEKSGFHAESRVRALSFFPGYSENLIFKPGGTAVLSVRLRYKHGQMSWNGMFCDRTHSSMCQTSIDSNLGVLLRAGTDEKVPDKLVKNRTSS